MTASRNPVVLLAMPAEKRRRLSQQLRRLGTEIIEVSDCTEGERVLETAEFDVIFTALHLPDGSWRRILADTKRGRARSPVVVCLNRIDGGWSDLLDHGAFDLLVEPYETENVRTVLHRAGSPLQPKSLAEGV